MAKLNALSSNALVASYYWGLDLSGSGNGAGGVGGLLMAQEGGNSYLPAYDAVGNIHGMIKASDGSLAAAYEYDAFGNTLRESGPYAASNPFRFATKYADLETGLVQYGLRYYSPTLGRFLNRDTISEQGGLNLYAFVNNNAVNHWDMLGMDDDADYRNRMALDVPEGGIRDMVRYYRNTYGQSSYPGMQGNSIAAAASAANEDYTMAFRNADHMSAIWHEGPSHTSSRTIGGTTYYATNNPGSVPDGANVLFQGTAAQAAGNAAAAQAELDRYVAATSAPNSSDHDVGPLSPLRNIAAGPGTTSAPVNPMATVQWVIDQTRTRGFGSIADKLQAKVVNGTIIIDPKLAGTDIAGQVNVFSTVLRLSPDYVGQTQFFANTVIHEYVHTVQNATIGTTLFTTGARLTSDVQALASATFNWVQGNGFNYADRAYDLDLAEKQARSLSNVVFPESWKPSR